MTLDLLEAARQPSSDPDVRVLLLTGAGTPFCSGTDLGAVNSKQRASPARRAGAGRAALRARGH
jgi:enoyl-CoA hydratase/carnithine racemase